MGHPSGHVDPDVLVWAAERSSAEQFRARAIAPFFVSTTRHPIVNPNARLTTRLGAPFLALFARSGAFGLSSGFNRDQMWAGRLDGDLCASAWFWGVASGFECAAHVVPRSYWEVQWTGVNSIVEGENSLNWPIGIGPDAPRFFSRSCLAIFQLFCHIRVKLSSARRARGKGYQGRWATPPPTLLSITGRMRWLKLLTRRASSRSRIPAHPPFSMARLPLVLPLQLWTGPQLLQPLRHGVYLRRPV